MKKDIEIPKSEHVYLAAIQEWNDDFQENNWYVYLINGNNQPLEMVITVSRAYGTIDGEQRKTGTFRHAFTEVKPNEAIKIELLDKQILILNNEFKVTYFLNDKMHEKNFVFKTNSINEKAQSDLPVIDKRGVLLK